MKVELITSGEDYEMRAKVKVDGKSIAYGYDFSECPEDANLTRGLSFVLDIPSALELAYYAGKAGETFEIVEREEK